MSLGICNICGSLIPEREELRAWERVYFCDLCNGMINLGLGIFMDLNIDYLERSLIIGQEELFPKQSQEFIN